MNIVQNNTLYTLIKISITVGFTSIIICLIYKFIGKKEKQWKYLK